MSTKFPAGIDLLLAGFCRGHLKEGIHVNQTMGKNCHIESLRAIRTSGCESTPSYTGAVEVAFSGSGTITFNAEEVKPTDLSTSAQSLFKFKDCPFETRMLETALLWLRADVYGDLAAAEELIARENVAMYGTVGREEALLFKRNCLPKGCTNLRNLSS